jgi:hypothetical protein
MIAPYSAAPPGAMAARAMMAQSVPLGLVQASGAMPAGSPSGVVQAQYVPGNCPGGVCPPNSFVPPGGNLAPPGMPPMPGMPGMPGGMVPPGMGQPPPGAVAAVGALHGPDHPRFPVQRTQVRFLQPSGMKVSWYTVQADGKPGYSENAIEVPGRYNFLQAAIYRLKLSNIAGQPGLELYPTLEVVPANPRTEEFLAHSPVPIAFSREDFRQVAAGNYLVKVIYLPRREFQDQAVLAPGEVVSTQLEPGADPIAEALRRGDILAVLRVGAIDQEAPNTPALGAPGPGHAAAFGPADMAMPPQMPAMGMGPGSPPPPRMNLYMTPPGGPAPGAPSVPTGAGPGFRPTSGPAAPVSQLPDPSLLQPPGSR